MKYLLQICLLVSTLFTLNSCASIMHGSSQEVPINSTPSGANVFINGQDIGVTPVTTTLKRKEMHTLVLELDGYQPFEMNLARKTSGWVWGNILFGGIIGLAVDAATGAIHKIEPAIVNANTINEVLVLIRVKYMKP